jgi:hypothetical protein
MVIKISQIDQILKSIGSMTSATLKIHTVNIFFSTPKLTARLDLYCNSVALQEKFDEM